MNHDPKNLTQRLNQSQSEKCGNAREMLSFGCSATPAPTPPVSRSDSRKSGVGAGFLDSRIIVGVGVKYEEEVKTKGERQHRGKPPDLSLGQVLDAGFSTPFPEGRTPFVGPVFFRFFCKEASNG